MPDRASALKDRIETTENAKNSLQDVEEDFEVMGDEDSAVPRAAEAFTESAGPTVETVLAKYKAFTIAGKLPHLTAAEWKRGVQETRVTLNRATAIARKNLARNANP
jgi:hypothetical protein